MRRATLIACALAGCGGGEQVLDWPDVRSLIVVTEDRGTLESRAYDHGADTATRLDLPEDRVLHVLGYARTLAEQDLRTGIGDALVTESDGAPLPPPVEAARVDGDGVIQDVGATATSVEDLRAAIGVPRAPCASLERARGSSNIVWPSEVQGTFVAAYAPRSAIVGFRDTHSSTGTLTLAAMWNVVDGQRTRIELPDILAPKGFADGDGTVWVLAQSRTSTADHWCRWPPGGPYGPQGCTIARGEVPRGVTALTGVRSGDRLEFFAVDAGQALHHAQEDARGEWVWRRLFQAPGGDPDRCVLNPRLDVLQAAPGGGVHVGFIGSSFERVTVDGDTVTRHVEFEPRNLDPYSCRTNYLRTPRVAELFVRLPRFDPALFPPYDVFWRRTPEAPWTPLDVVVGEPRMLLFELSSVSFGITTIATAFSADVRQRPDLAPRRCPPSPLSGQAVAISVRGEEVVILTEGSIDTFPLRPTSLGWYEVP